MHRKRRTRSHFAKRARSLVIAWVAATNALSFTDTLIATQQSYPVHGLTNHLGDEAWPVKLLLVPHGVGHGIMRASGVHMRRALLDSGYCSEFSPARNVFVGSALVLGGYGLMAATTNYMVVGAPGSLLAGVVSGGYTGAAEIATDGAFANTSPCAGKIPYKAPSFR